MLDRSRILLLLMKGRNIQDVIDGNFQTNRFHLIKLVTKRII